MFGLMKKKDPICGMKEEKGKGMIKHGKWFCSQNCVDTFEENTKAPAETHSCCH